MKSVIKLVCPEHGEFEITIERKPHVEYRDMFSAKANPIMPRFTGKCPKCGKRIIYSTK